VFGQITFLTAMVEASVPANLPSVFDKLGIGHIPQ
jgi:hypothetical protein